MQLYTVKLLRRYDVRAFGSQALSEILLYHSYIKVLHLSSICCKVFFLNLVTLNDVYVSPSQGQHMNLSEQSRSELSDLLLTSRSHTQTDFAIAWRAFEAAVLLAYGEQNWLVFRTKPSWDVFGQIPLVCSLEALDKCGHYLSQQVQFIDLNRELFWRNYA